MSVRVTIFDPTTQNSNTVTVAMSGNLIQEDLDPYMDYYVRLSTTAKRGPTGADNIPSEIVRGLSDLALGTQQFKSGSTSPYGSITDSIEDYVLKMVEGVNPGEEMYFG